VCNEHVRTAAAVVLFIAVIADTADFFCHITVKVLLPLSHQMPTVYVLSSASQFLLLLRRCTASSENGLSATKTTSFIALNLGTHGFDRTCAALACCRSIRAPCRIRHDTIGAVFMQVYLRDEILDLSVRP
jgi:hypothetical protein